jgi:AcrR family transcriptional regulator
MSKINGKSAGKRKPPVKSATKPTPKKRSPKPSPSDSVIAKRILESARDLIYRNGFFKTGIRQIAKQANTSVSNLYVYFQSKQDLAIWYLNEEENLQIQRLETLMKTYPDPRQFLRIWILRKKMDRKRNQFLGCPFAGMSYQTSDWDPVIQNRFREIQENWINTLQKYLNNAKMNGYLPENSKPEGLADRILAYYQGCILNWRLTGDLRYWKVMENLMERELDLLYT